MPIRAAALVLLATCLAPACAAEPSPCDDINYARDFKVRYPGEVNKVFDAENKQQMAWSARAKAIGDRVVEVGAATRAQQNASTLALMRSPEVVAFDAQAQKSADEFRMRNDTLLAAPVVAVLDPARPNRAWCILATQALQSLNDKVSAEIASWSALDRAMLAAAAGRGVQFAN